MLAPVEAAALARLVQEDEMKKKRYVEIGIEVMESIARFKDVAKLDDARLRFAIILALAEIAKLDDARLRFAIILALAEILERIAGDVRED